MVDCTSASHNLQHMTSQFTRMSLHQCHTSNLLYTDNHHSKGKYICGQACTSESWLNNPGLSAPDQCTITDVAPCCQLHLSAAALSYSNCSYHAWSSVVSLDVIHKVIASQSADVFSRAQDGSAQWAVLERCSMQVVEDDLLSNTLHLQASFGC